MEEAISELVPDPAPTGAAPTSTRGVPDDIDFVPTTEFGRRLLELRRRALAEGQPLLTREELARELAERRGGVDVGDRGRLSRPTSMREC